MNAPLRLPAPWPPAGRAALAAAVLALGALAPCAADAGDGRIYSWVDDAGSWHFVDDLRLVPPKYRSQAAGQSGARSPDLGGRYSVVAREAAPSPEAPAPAAGASPRPQGPAGPDTRAIRILPDGTVYDPDAPPRRAPARAPSRPDAREGGDPAPRPATAQGPAPTRAERIAGLETRRERLAERLTLLEEGYVGDGAWNPDNADLDLLVEKAQRDLDRIDGQLEAVRSGREPERDPAD
ncbi:hypothetical protein L6R50_15135 [Myxococcota bacterium]|nr:hypothetical protein [Myxococcota bacterium]